MSSLSLNPLRRWWQAAFAATAPAFVPALAFRRSAVRPAARLAGRRPVTPFDARSGTAASLTKAHGAARRFWMTLDPQDRRHAAIGGSFAEVCAALERLSALEEGCNRSR